MLADPRGLGLGAALENRLTHMQLTRFVLVTSLLLGGVGCGSRERKPADPLAGLSAVEQRAAKAHAANVCTLTKGGATDDRSRADGVAGLSDLAVGLQKGDHLKILEAGTSLARDQGCVPPAVGISSVSPVQEPASTGAPQPTRPNSHVADNLNAADGMFKEGMDGCPSVTLAIMAANNPSAYGPTTTEQRREVKQYADKCGLRFYP